MTSNRKKLPRSTRRCNQNMSVRRRCRRKRWSSWNYLWGVVSLSSCGKKCNSFDLRRIKRNDEIFFCGRRTKMWHGILKAWHTIESHTVATPIYRRVFMEFLLTGVSLGKVISVSQLSFRLIRCRLNDKCYSRFSHHLSHAPYDWLTHDTDDLFDRLNYYRFRVFIVSDGIGNIICCDHSEQDGCLEWKQWSASKKAFGTYLWHNFSGFTVSNSGPTARTCLVNIKYRYYGRTQKAILPVEQI